MENHTDTKRGYHRISKSYYQNAVDGVRVSFGMYSDDGSTSGEMMMNWIELGDELCAQLTCFEDAFSALSLFTDVVQKLGEVDSQNIQEEDFCKLLDQCGFADLTRYSIEEPSEKFVHIKILKSEADKLGLDYCE